MSFSQGKTHSKWVTPRGLAHFMRCTRTRPKYGIGVTFCVAFRVSFSPAASISNPFPIADDEAACEGFVLTANIGEDSIEAAQLAFCQRFLCGSAALPIGSARRDEQGNPVRIRGGTRRCERGMPHAHRRKPVTGAKVPGRRRMTAQDGLAKEQLIPEARARRPSGEANRDRRGIADRVL